MLPNFYASNIVLFDLFPRREGVTIKSANWEDADTVGGGLVWKSTAAVEGKCFRMRP